MIGYADDVDPETFSPALKDLEKSFLERYDRIPGPFRIWVNNETVALRMKQHSDFTVRGTSLSVRENEIVILVCARALNCEYVSTAHKRNASRAGITDAQIEALCSGGDPAFADVREQAIFEVAQEMGKGRIAPKAAYEKAAASIGVATICETAALYGFYATCAVSLNFLGVTP